MKKFYLDNFSSKIQNKWKLIKELILVIIDDNDDILLDIYYNLSNIDEEIKSILNSDIKTIRKKNLLIKTELKLLAKYIKEEKTISNFIDIRERLSGWNLMDLCKNGHYKMKGQLTYFVSGSWAINQEIYRLLESYGLTTTSSKSKNEILSIKNNNKLKLKSTKKTK